MKFTQKKLLLLYGLAFVFFVIHFLINTTECKGYYIHDDAIEIAPAKLIINSLVLFLLPGLMLLISEILKLKDNFSIFRLHYVFALLALGLFALAINKPCETTNGGHYMFINVLTIGLSFLFRLTSYITLIWLFIKTVTSVLRLKK